MTTLKQLIESSNIPSKLIRSTIKQFGGWEQFKEIAEDVINHGIDGGFGDFIYYDDTIAFTRHNRKEIIEMAENQSEELGQGMLEMIQNFNCIDDYSQDEIAKAIYTGRGDDITQIYNCLAWYAGEEVCREYIYYLDSVKS